MIPHPYPMDAQSRASDLASTILAASTTPQIAAACSSVSSFLHRHASDQSRAFFSIAFPALVCRLFGFDDSRPPNSPSGWIDQSTTSPDLVTPLLSLLAPSSPLLASIAAADSNNLIRYAFPLERLPEWMRLALQTNPDAPALADLCPLLSRVKEDKVQSSLQLQLNVFEYYYFWFAYYPVCRGNSETPESRTVTKTRLFRVQNWTASLPVLAARRAAQKTAPSLYLQLLYAYLKTFVPKCGVGAYQPYRSSLLHYTSSYDNSAFKQAEFLVYALIHFWLIDNDFSPFPVSLCRSFGVFPHRAVLGETPPTAGLADAVKLLVKYVNCGLVAPADGDERKVLAQSPVWKGSGSEDAGKVRGGMISLENSFGAWNSVMQRPLYRFVLRTFLFCPMGASIKNAEQVFSLWMAYITPWKTTKEDFAEFEVRSAGDSDGGQNENPSSQSTSKEGYRMETEYGPIWQGYVLSNYLFYSSLVVHFLGFAHKFLHANVESTIQMVSKLLDILTSSKELLDLLKKVDAAYHSKLAGPATSHPDSLYKYVPSIREQLPDWEDGLCESDADGSFLHENWNLDLKLFSDTEQGARKLLQLFVLRAGHEIQSITGDVSQNLQALDSIRSQMNVLLGGFVRDPQLSNSPEKAYVPDHDRVDVFTPKHPGFGKRKWADLNYKGDSMRRPISDTEVAWLARVLINLSDWLNKSLRLERADIFESAGPIVVDVAACEHAGGPKEFVYMVVGFLSSCLGLFCCWVLRFMREHGMRINLRFLASKKAVMVLVAAVTFFVLRRCFLVPASCLSDP